MASIAEPRHGKIRRLFNSALGFDHVSQIESFVRQYSAALPDTRATGRR